MENNQWIQISESAPNLFVHVFIKNGKNGEGGEEKTGCRVCSFTFSSWSFDDGTSRRVESHDLWKKCI